MLLDAEGGELFGGELVSLCFRPVRNKMDSQGIRIRCVKHTYIGYDTAENQNNNTVSKGQCF